LQTSPNLLETHSGGIM